MEQKNGREEILRGENRAPFLRSVLEQNVLEPKIVRARSVLA